MDQAFRDLIEFETRCGHPPTDQPPGIPDERTQALRIRLITEEYVELTTALTAGDLPEIADGIADLIYVCIGTAVRLGLDLPQIWQAVACANLAKFGPGSHREPDGKVSKPKYWVHPDIAAILANQRPLAETYAQKDPVVLLEPSANDSLRKRVHKLEAALESQRRWWHQIPSGIDLEADPENTSPDDSSAHIAGLAVQEIDACLKVGP